MIWIQEICGLLPLTRNTMNMIATKNTWTNDKKYVFKWSLIASIAGLAFNVIADPIVGYFYKQYILGQPQEVASILAKLSAGATFVNAIVSTILVVIIYNAVRPALIKANLIHVYVTAANAK